MIGVRAVRGCSCAACDQLRGASWAVRLGRGTAVLGMFVLMAGGVALLLLLLAWACVAVARQLW